MSRLRRSCFNSWDSWPHSAFPELLSFLWLLWPLMFFSEYMESKLGSLKSLSLFERSVDLFLSCWRVTTEAQHRTGQRFVACNVQSPNSYSHFPSPCRSRSIAHCTKWSTQALCILGKDVIFDSLVHMWHSHDHVPLCAVLCRFLVFGWLGLIWIFMWSMGLYVILECKIMY